MQQITQQTTFPASLEEFLAWEPNDGFKYEWNDGEVVKFGKRNKRFLKLFRKLARLFHQTKAFEMGGALFSGQDVCLHNTQLRRPDLAFFSAEQIENADFPDPDIPIPAFAIEVISTTDQILAVKNKLRQYFQYGIRVVWLIYPEDKVVEMYTNFKTVKICCGSDLCSALPVLEDFEIPAEELFT